MLKSRCALAEAGVAMNPDFYLLPPPPKKKKKKKNFELCKWYWNILTKADYSSFNIQLCRVHLANHNNLVRQSFTKNHLVLYLPSKGVIETHKLCIGYYLKLDLVPTRPGGNPPPHRSLQSLYCCSLIIIVILL